MNNIGKYSVIDKLFQNEKYSIYTLDPLENKKIYAKVFDNYIVSQKNIGIALDNYKQIKDDNINGIINIIDILEYQNRLTLIIEDLDAKPLKDYFENYTFDLDKFFIIAIKLTKIIADLHKKNFIHENINSHNIMYNSTNDSLKLAGVENLLDLDIQNMKGIDNFLLEELHYIAPEQTERVGDTIDEKSDLYSLGVVFYEILCGNVPFFNEKDRLKIIHSHIALTPTAPNVINYLIPKELSALVMKLLSKNTHERYFSVFGLLGDLNEMYREWRLNDHILNCYPGKNDFTENLIFKDKVYGRKEEIQIFKNAVLHTFKTGEKSTVVISGQLGQGKTSFVKGIKHLIDFKKGFWGTNITADSKYPYYSIIENFKVIITGILSKCDHEIVFYKNKIKEKLSSVAVLVDIIPDLQYFIDVDLEKQKFSLDQKNNLFKDAMRELLKILTSKEHPITFFINDYDKLSFDSIEMLQSYMDDSAIKYFCLVLSVNDEAHKIPQNMKGFLNITKITLKPLSFDDFRIWMIDIFHSYELDDLFEIVYRKTNGNPYFIKNFLRDIFEKGYLYFNFDLKKWDFDDVKIKNMVLSNNMPDIIAKNISNLSDDRQRFLNYIACLNSLIEENILKILAKDDFDLINFMIDSDILIIKIILNKKYYVFSHIDIGNNILKKISDQEKKRIHYELAIILSENLDNSLNFTDIVKHYNLALELLRDEDERIKAIGLNLKSGKQARNTTATKVALRYYQNAVTLFLDNYWDQYYDLIKDLFFEIAESEYLVGNQEQSKFYFNELMKHLKYSEKIEVYQREINIGILSGNLKEALNIGIEGLAFLGIKIKKNIKKTDILLFITKLRFMLHKKPIDYLYNFHLATNKEKIILLNYISVFSTVAYLVDRKIYAMLSFIMLKLSLNYGYTRVTSFAFANYGAILAGIFKKYKRGYKYGKLAIDLSEKIESKEMQAKSYFAFGMLISHWGNSSYESIDFLKESCRRNKEIGNFTYTAYSLSGISFMDFFNGRKFDDKYLEELHDNMIFAKNINMKSTFFISNFLYSNIKALKQETMNFDESENEKSLLNEVLHGQISSALQFYYVVKIFISYIFEKTNDAAIFIDEYRKYEQGSTGLIFTADFCFYETLVLIRLLKDNKKLNRNKYLKKIKGNISEYKKWTEAFVDNFQGRYFLLQAEYLRLKKDYNKAFEFYPKAIDSLKRNGFYHICAIAYELNAKAYMENNRSDISKYMFEEAVKFYKMLDMTAKVNFIIENCLLNLENKDIQNKIDLYSDKEFDWNMAVKLVSDISKEKNITSLADKLLTVLIENSGAQGGAVIIKNDNGFFVISSNINDEEMQTIKKIDDYENIALNIINYVIKTKKEVILANALDDDFFSSEIILSRKVKSLLVIPMLSADRIIGIIYLENNLIENIFDGKIANIVKLISSQIRLPLENLLLIESLEKKILIRTKEVSEKMNEIEIINKTITKRNLHFISILNNTGEGFLMFGDDLKIQDEYSHECIKIFNRHIENAHYNELIYPKDERQSEFIKELIGSILSEKNTKKRNLMRSLLPVEIKIEKKNISLKHKLIRDFSDKKSSKFFMVILNDITEKKNLEKQMKEEHVKLQSVVKTVVWYNDFITLIISYKEFVKNLIPDFFLEFKSNESIVLFVYRKIHTFKGNFSLYGLENLIERLHVFETYLSEKMSGWMNKNIKYFWNDIAKFNLVEWLDEEMIELKNVLGRSFYDQESKFVIYNDRFSEVKKNIQAHFPTFEGQLILNEIDKLTYKPFKSLFRIYVNIVDTIAERLEKFINPLVIKGGDFFIDIKKYNKFAETLVHIFRNCIDHGIEAQEVRESFGKAMYGNITVNLSKIENDIIISIKDDGQGLDFTKIKTVAEEKLNMTKEELESMDDRELSLLIFNDGFSTKNEITQLSGRGIGLAAVKEAVDDLNGKIEIFSKEGSQTEFKIILPLEKNKVLVDNIDRYNIKFIIEIFKNIKKYLHESKIFNILTINDVNIVKVDKIELSELSSVLDFSGMMNGTVIITVENKFAMRLVKSFMGEDFDDFGDDSFAMSAMSEYLNIIIGNALKNISIDGVTYLDIKPPYSVIGNDTSIVISNIDIYRCDLETKEGNLVFYYTKY